MVPRTDRSPPLGDPPEERERIAEAVATRLDMPMTAAGVVFLLLVVAETVSAPAGAVGTAFTAASWVLWAAFVAEFVVRMAIAPSAWAYLRRNWWQVVFLAVPFLRFLRAVRAVRAARVGRVVSSAVRSGRSAGRNLSSRLATLAVVTLIVILAASQLFYEAGDYGSYGGALHAAALATMAGEPTGSEDGVIRALEVVLIGYSVVVFAAMAGAFGAFLVERSGRAAPDGDRKARPRP